VRFGDGVGPAEFLRRAAEAKLAAAYFQRTGRCSGVLQPPAGIAFCLVVAVCCAVTRCTEGWACAADEAGKCQNMQIRGMRGACGLDLRIVCKPAISTAAYRAWVGCTARRRLGEGARQEEGDSKHKDPEPRRHGDPCHCQVDRLLSCLEMAQMGENERWSRGDSQLSRELHVPGFAVDKSST
jgi:hypothetical protein